MRGMSNAPKGQNCSDDGDAQKYPEHILNFEAKWQKQKHHLLMRKEQSKRRKHACNSRRRADHACLGASNRQEKHHCLQQSTGDAAAKIEFEKILAAECALHFTA